MQRRLGALGAVALSLTLLAVPSLAGARQKETLHPGKYRGIVHAHNAGGARSGGGNLAYHNGPVMHTNAVYTIFWVPSGYSIQPGYDTVINGFFQNVAAASGQTSNVYFSDTQYSDTAGRIGYASAYKGSITDTNAFPASGCSDSYTSVCLTDTQIQNEISRVVTANGLTKGDSTEFFLFTPKNVGSCFTGSNQCAYSYYCAYHSNIGTGSGEILYANMPYAAFVSSACGSGQSPNGNDADSTLNVTSHEHNETITDPLGSAWYDSRGNENGDKCAWNFGAPLGGTSGAEYNQVINGAHYYLQQEWSNHSSGCVLTGV